MKKPTHNIRITTVQRDESGDEDKIFVSAKGSVTGTGDDYTIVYTEDGKKGETTLHITDGRRISVLRKGDIGSFIIIEKNVTHQSHHKLENGVGFTTSARGRYIKSDFDNGKLSFCYSNDINMVPTVEITFDFSFSLI